MDLFLSDIQILSSMHHWELCRTASVKLAVKIKQQQYIINQIRNPKDPFFRIRKYYLNKILSLSGPIPNLKLTRAQVIIVITGKIWKLWVLTSSRWVTEISSRARIITRHVYPPASWGWVFTSIGLSSFQHRVEVVFILDSCILVFFWQKV